MDTHTANHRRAGARLATFVTAGVIASLGLTTVGAPGAAHAEVAAIAGDETDDAASSERISEEKRAEAQAYARERFPASYDPSSTGVGDGSTVAASSSLPRGVWKLFHQTVVNGGKVGVKHLVAEIFGGTDPAMTELQQLTEALGNLDAGINGLRGEMAGIRTDVQALLSTTEWGQFYAADDAASLAASDISSAAALVAEELQVLGDDEVPSTSTQERIANLTYGSIGRIDDQLFGVTSPGSVALLQKALSRQVSGDAWKQIDAYRDYYRAAAASAVANLDLLADFNSDYATEAAATRAQSEALGNRLDTIGIGPVTAGIGLDDAGERIDSPAYLHVNGADWLYAHPDRPTIAGEYLKMPYTTSLDYWKMFGHLEQLRDHHVANRTDSTSFEAELSRLGYPTQFPMRHKGSKDGVTCNVHQQYCSAQTITIAGDELASNNWEKTSWGELVDRYGTSDPDEVMARFRSEIDDNSPYIVAHVQTNAGGFAVDRVGDTALATSGPTDIQVTGGSDATVVHTKVPGNGSGMSVQLSAAGVRTSAVTPFTTQNTLTGATHGQEWVSLDMGPAISDARTKDAVGVLPGAAIPLDAAGSNQITVDVIR